MISNRRKEGSDVPPRVLHLCAQFSPLTQTFIHEYIVELERSGGDNHILTLSRVNAASRPFPKIHVTSLPAWWRLDVAWRRLMTETRVYAKLMASLPALRTRWEEVIEEIEPDVLHAHFGPMGVAAVPIVESSNLPLLVSFYGYDASALPREAYWDTRYRNLWSRASGVVVLSRAMRQRLIELGCPDQKISVVHLARDLGAFPFSVRARKVRALLSIGRLTEKKGHIDAIQAVERLYRNGVEIRLRIVGAGELSGSLARYIADNGLQDIVELAGPVDAAKVVDELNRADAFILTSRTAASGDEEGTPTVLIEAQAVGLPCVVTDHAGMPEMIPTENQWLIAEQGDVAGIAERIERLVCCTPDQLATISNAGRRKVEREFEVASQAAALQRLYQGLVGQSGSRKPRIEPASSAVDSHER